MSTTGSPPLRFSVIVPTFDRADTITATLESLRSQTFREFEVIVVDDGSTDGTAEVVKGIDVDRLTYRWQPNAGPSAARNLGADLAVGEYLTFLDTADQAHPDWLESFDTMIRAYGCSLVSCGADFTRDGHVVRTRLPRQLGPGAGRVIAFFRTGCFAVRRELFWDVGGFDPALRFSEVTELGMRIGRTVSGRPNAVTHLARSTVSVELPAMPGRGGRATSLAYSDRRRLETAAYILAKHEDVMASTPRLRRTYLRIAGVASARLGDYAGARRYFAEAWRAQPRALGELGRVAVTFVPGVRRRLWPSKS